MYYGITKLAIDFDEVDMNNWKVNLLKILLFFIPRANPDIEKFYPLVKSWALEIDDEGWPQREIGLDINDSPLFFTPNNKNTGFWTDMAITQFTHEELISISQQEFENLWNAAKSACPDFEELNSDSYIDEPQPLPAWLTIVVGIFLLPICILYIIGSITVIFIPDPPYPIFNIIGGSLFVALSILMTTFIFRLTFNIKRKTPGLFTPLVLRIIGICATLIPIIALLVGSFWDKPIIHSFMTISYILVAISLWKLAANRELAEEKYDDG
ncbi:MAG: hypothetical protein MI865_13515 [Proteobacteria bacterium]|nr:hypothetical protein [Pseudomonadota bacterium]